MTYYRSYQDGGKVEPSSIRNWFQKRYGAKSGQVESLIKQIGTIESDNRDVVQVTEGGGEGPGRGFFQFEKTYKDPKTGKYGQASGLTARNRLAKIYWDLEGEVPDWLSQEGMQDPKIGFDAMGLSTEQQEELLLANFAQNPLATEKLIKGALESGDAKDLWLQAHWAGKKEDEKEKSKYWDEKFQGMADGGEVIEQNTDTVPAMLTPGEFVIRKDAADQIGPEKLQMLNNIDRLSNTALLETAKSPMGYQEGGLISGLMGGMAEKYSDLKSLFGDKQRFSELSDEQFEKTSDQLFDFVRNRRQSQEFISENPEVVSTPNLPLREGEQVNLMDALSPQAYTAKDFYSSPEPEGSSKKEYAVESLGEQPFMGVTATPEPEPEERKWSHDEQMRLKDHVRYMINAPGGDIYEKMKDKYGVDIATEEFDIAGGEEGKEKTDWLKVFLKVGDLEVEDYKAKKKEISEYREEGLVRDPLSQQWVDPYEYYTPEARELMSWSIPAHRAHGQEHGWRMPTGSARQEGGYINGYQNGGEVMNYQNGGQMNDVLSVFGEKSKQGDEMQKLMAMAAMQEMQRAQQVQQAIGMRGGGYVDTYQQGGAVEPPMSGPESGPQEPPMPGGDQTYHQPAMEQLDMDQYEYASYVDHGPDMYKWMAPKYKSKQQWTPYDAMVDAGTIDPYEIGKDEISVVTNDQLEALSNQAKESMRV
jgi:hypothetical protein|tara:strand:+ start:4521 stop:6626 length:2106 start_codon:yes stop_codon:yes gene_type:complete